METFNTDPKPGRLILPLVLIGMIATTYTFVQNATEVTIEEPVPTTVEAIVVEESIVELQLHYNHNYNTRKCFSLLGRDKFRKDSS